MKEQKNSIGMSLSGYTPSYHQPKAPQTLAPTRFSLFDFEFTFGIGSAAMLLHSVVSVFWQSYSITNCSVGYKYINILCLFSGL